jgi:UDP-glucose 4-epimerase
MAYYRDKKLPVIIVRLFNTTGPRQTGRYGMVLPRFVKQALESQPLTVYGDGQQTRCFCYVGDVVWALTELIRQEAAIGQIYNIGSHHEIKIIDLAQLVLQTADSRSKIIHVPYDQAYSQGFEDMMRRVPDISKISALIGFKPKVELTEIIAGLINHHLQKG